jgi:predicted transcriptional regulator YdeE
MSHEIRQKAAFTIVGISRRQSNEHAGKIGLQWQEFFAAGGPGGIPNRTSDQVFSVYTEYEGDHTKPYTLILGCEVARVGELPEGLVAKSIPAAKYAVFAAKGPQPQAIIEAWQRIWSSPISPSFTADFDFHRGENDVEVFVAVK